MIEILRQNPEFLMGLAGMVSVFGTIIAIAGMLTWRKHQATKMETELKMEMLARGMSADEIERVLAARPGGKTLSEAYHCGSK
jgi:hypothetical protein